MFGVYGMDELGLIYLVAENLMPAKSVSDSFAFTETQAHEIARRFFEETGRFAFVLEAA